MTIDCVYIKCHRISLIISAPFVPALASVGKAPVAGGGERWESSVGKLLRATVAKLYWQRLAPCGSVTKQTQTGCAAVTKISALKKTGNSKKFLEEKRQ